MIDSRTPSPERVPKPPTAATRHLCVGVHVERAFRDLVIRKVHNDPYHRVAPSSGFDLVPVVRHAWWAWWLDTTLLAMIPGFLTLSWLLGHRMAAVLAATVLAASCLLWFAVRTVPGLIRLKIELTAKEWRERTAKGRVDDPSRLRRRIRQLKAAGAASALVFVMPSAAAASLGEQLRESVAAAGWLLLAIVGVAAGAGVVRQVLLDRVRNAPSLRPAKPSRRERTIDAQQRHQCVVYRRPADSDDDEPHTVLVPGEDLRSPFIGSGELVHRWSPPLTIQLLSPDTGDAPRMAYTSPPFTASQLTDHIRSALEELDGDAETFRMRDVEVTDRLYIAEADLSEDRRLLQGRVRDEDFAYVIDNPHADADHFLVVTVPSAGAELVTSLFLRVSVKGRTLTLEFAACALPRTPEEHRSFDGFAEHGTWAVVRSALRSVLGLPATVGRIARIAEVPVVLACAAWATKDRTLRPKRGVLNGTRVSVREEACQVWNDISQRDRDVVIDQVKILEQWILTEAELFLDAHGVDTSTFKKQAVNIINSGVLNMGGKTEVKGSAVGTNNRVNDNSDGSRGSADDNVQEG